MGRGFWKCSLNMKVVMVQTVTEGESGGWEITVRAVVVVAVHSDVSSSAREQVL